MNVIGIIQTDLNEFSVLFEQQQGGEQGGGQHGHGGGHGQNQNQHDQQNDQGSDSMFLSFLDEQPSGQEGNSGNGGGGQHQQQQQQNGPQEMTVRIKGIPEGQKANFLQMYQILQDAQDTQSLGQSLTIVNQGDQQEGGQGNNQGQAQGHGSSKQNRTTH